MAGTMDKLKGKAKEVAGAVTGDRETESKGKLDQAKGSAKNAAENVKEHVKERAQEALDRAAEKAKDVAERAEDESRGDPDDA